ncbi:MAG: hypothetical protein JGK24_26515 [Microcoleus sp. PH2017_29_MFU_D_A]|nr:MULTISPECIES: hypothetical protein [unclassified Microcoleus]MCC3563505.1 hypothetical protein [Microcoleus sp. PH2017_27_LUM_O_A]MCC3606678.1 hypothetical protein [Microcoleus sp. PH2017_29_MFU_D_A]MCC3426445.1 hypothetical protein [Microcoleus sp. PH2017_01_SCD_O_A]MCC3456704.1 hypothetical protein [Microcoleus sp. PH2017_08_TRC_O_A]MCC3598502.1 hypothetical protein [Microcoleus sp. PH2017_26_ELK_O_A]
MAVVKGIPEIGLVLCGRSIIQQTLSCFAFKLGFLSAETASLAEIARSI